MNLRHYRLVQRTCTLITVQMCSRKLKCLSKEINVDGLAVLRPFQQYLVISGQGRGDYD